MNGVERCADELIIRGIDDWVDAAEVASIAMNTGGARSPDDIRDLSLRTIRHVVEAGLAEIGEVTVHDGYRKWDMPPEAALERVEREWLALGRGPDLGELCWLCNTQAGDERGRLLLQIRERKPEGTA